MDKNPMFYLLTFQIDFKYFFNIHTLQLKLCDFFYPTISRATNDPSVPKFMLQQDFVIHHIFLKTICWRTRKGLTGSSSYVFPSRDKQNHILFNYNHFQKIFDWPKLRLKHFFLHYLVLIFIVCASKLKSKTYTKNKLIYSWL